MRCGDGVNCYSCVSTNYERGEDTCLEDSFDKDEVVLLTGCDCCRVRIPDGKGVLEQCNSLMFVLGLGLGLRGLALAKNLRPKSFQTTQEIL